MPSQRSSVKREAGTLNVLGPPWSGIAWFRRRQHQDGRPAQEWNVNHDAKRKSKRDPGYHKKNHLEGMEAHETVLVKRSHHQKNDGGNNVHIGQHVGYILIYAADGSLRGCLLPLGRRIGTPGTTTI